MLCVHRPCARLYSSVFSLLQKPTNVGVKSRIVKAKGRKWRNCKIHIATADCMESSQNGFTVAQTQEKVNSDTKRTVHNTHKLLHLSPILYSANKSTITVFDETSQYRCNTDSNTFLHSFSYCISYQIIRSSVITLRQILTIRRPEKFGKICTLQMHSLDGGIRRGVQKTKNRFGFGFKNWTVQIFDIRSDGFPTETACNP